MAGAKVADEAVAGDKALAQTGTESQQPPEEGPEPKQPLEQWPEPKLWPKMGLEASCSPRRGQAKILANIGPDPQ